MLHEVRLKVTVKKIVNTQKIGIFSENIKK